jgi:hypothetical protein
VPPNVRKQKCSFAQVADSHSQQEAVWWQHIAEGVADSNSQLTKEEGGEMRSH